jgi:hypothetical protein
MTKELLLASLGGLALEQVLLFERLEADVIHWLRFDAQGATRTASARAAYDKLVAPPPKRGEVRIDRAWAIAAVEAMIQSQN